MSENKTRMTTQLFDCAGDKIYSDDKLLNESSKDSYVVKFGRYSVDGERFSYGFYLVNLEFLSIHEMPDDINGKIKLKKESAAKSNEHELYLNLKCSGVNLGASFDKKFAATYSESVQIGEYEFKQARVTKVFSYRDSFLKVIEWLKSIGVKDPDINSVEISGVDEWKHLNH